MADISGLLEDASHATLRRRGEESVDNECCIRSVLSKLHSWRWSWDARNRHSVFEINANKTSPFQTVLYYACPTLMYEIWLYNALLIILFGLLEAIGVREAGGPRRHRLAGPLLRPGEENTSETAAIEICRSFEYQLRNLSAPAPFHQWATPLALAYVTLDPNEPVALWVLERVQAAPKGRSFPWLVHIGHLQGRGDDTVDDVFARWPVTKKRVPILA